MQNVLKDYFDALERLKKGQPIHVASNSKITKDSVSLEAGRKKGSIKKIRPIFHELIEAIDEAARSLSKPDDEVSQRLIQLKAESARYRLLWEEALSREVSLVKQLWEEREAWSKERRTLTGSSVVQMKNARRS